VVALSQRSAGGVNAIARGRCVWAVTQCAVEMLSCPWCTALLPPLAARCETCSHFLPPAAEAGKPACARHPAFGAQAACQRCGTFSCAACFDQTPFCEGCRKLGTAALPWDERRRVGTWRAFWRTVPEVMLRPDQTFARATPEGGAFDSLLFLGIASFLSVVTSVIALGLLVGGTIAFMGTGPGSAEASSKLGPLAAVGIGAGAIAIYLVVGWLVTAAGMLVLALLDHVLVRLFGGAGGFEVTLRANALSMAPAVIGLLPFCGAYVWPVWTLVAKVFAYKGLHKLPTLQAVAAALIPSVGLTVFLGLAYLALLVATGAFG
jgi:hypothetical protein